MIRLELEVSILKSNLITNIFMSTTSIMLENKKIMAWLKGTIIYKCFFFQLSILVYFLDFKTKYLFCPHPLPSTNCITLQICFPYGFVIYLTKWLHMGHDLNRSTANWWLSMQIFPNVGSKNVRKLCSRL